MSWGIISEKTKQCPCKKGTFMIILKSDDWNRIEEDWKMNCTICSDKYILGSDFTETRNLDEIKYYWIEKNVFEESEKLKTQAQKLVGKSVSIAKGSYFNMWKSYFDKKSKKYIWRKLTNNGAEYPSLTTFYSHVREIGIEQHLADFFENRTIEALRIINIENEEIDNLVAIATELTTKAKELVKDNRIF